MNRLSRLNRPSGTRRTCLAGHRFKGIGTFDILITMMMFSLIMISACAAIGKMRKKAPAATGAPLKAAATTPAQAPAQTPSSAATTTVAHAGSQHAGLYSVWTVVAVLALVLIFAAIIFVTWTSARVPQQPVTVQRGEQDTVAARWRTALARHDTIADEYGTIRLDPIAAIEHMALWDVTIASTAAFVNAYTKMSDLRSVHGEKQPSSRTDVIEYETSTREAALAWGEARGYAAHAGTTMLPVTDQRLARKATGLLRRAADAAATEPERALAAAKAKDILDQLSVRWPEETTTAIETIVRRELEAAAIA